MDTAPHNTRLRATAMLVFALHSGRPPADGSSDEFLQTATVPSGAPPLRLWASTFQRYRSYSLTALKWAVLIAAVTAPWVLLLTS